MGIVFVRAAVYNKPMSSTIHLALADLEGRDSESE